MPKHMISLSYVCLAVYYALPEDHISEAEMTIYHSSPFLHSMIWISVNNKINDGGFDGVKEKNF